MRALFLALLCAGRVLAGDIQTDPPGSPERKPLLDALHATDAIRQLSADWKSPIVFRQVTIRRAGDWAWLQASPGTPDGRRNTEPLDGVMNKTRGGWTLVDFVSDEVAPADDPDRAFRDWQASFRRAHPGCPPEIFPAKF